MRMLKMYVFAIFGAIIVSITAVQIEECVNDEGHLPTNAPTAKGIKGICTHDSDCYTSFGTEGKACVNGRCGCKLDYEPKELSHVLEKEWECQQLPGLDEECTSRCRRPYTCTDKSKTKPGTCKCVSPYTFQDGHCYLECDKDEIYQDFMCKKRCSLDDVKTLNETCMKTVGLGGPCIDSDACITSFSECKSGKCVCMKGFKETTKHGCESARFTCPLGEPLKNSQGTVTICIGTVLRDSYGLINEKSPECPDGYFCLISTPTEEGTDVTKGIGHCCPGVMKSCPIGEAVPTDPNSRTGCPDTYYIYYYYVRFDGTPLCCPKPCTLGKVFVNGTCYSKKSFGDKCEVDEQCQNDQVGKKIECKQGRCLCADGYTSKNTTVLADKTMRFSCEVDCDPDTEWIIDDKCVPLLKIGDTCGGDISNACTQRSRCSFAAKKCVCQCGFKQITDRICGPKPDCEYSDIWNENNKNEDFNVTDYIFCQVPKSNRAPVPGLVDKCPKGQYCAKYMTQVGVCCARPKPKCPNGKKGTADCDPNKPKSCGTSQKCLKFIDNIAIRDIPTDGYVCCPDG